MLTTIFPYLLLLLLISTSEIFAKNLSSSKLDSTIGYYALREISRQRRTGVLYQVHLPANLSGIEASAMRLRSGSFWSKGANSTNFIVPPRMITLLPFVRRLVVVYQNLGNWSSLYYSVPGYSLAAPVVGFLAYNASSSITTITEIQVQVGEVGVVVNFSRVSLAREVDSNSTKCAIFGRDGSVRIGAVVGENACLARGTGHFAIIVPSEVVPREGGGGGGSWWVWVGVGVGGGVVGMVLLALVGKGILEVVTNKKREVMEERAEEGVALKSVWINGESRMPSATVTRTQPVIETGPEVP